jgi:hypothetical protein
MTEQEMEEQRNIDRAIHKRPEWALMMMADAEASMRATLSGRPYSNLPRESILNWIRSLEC